MDWKRRESPKVENAKSFAGKKTAIISDSKYAQSKQRENKPGDPVKTKQLELMYSECRFIPNKSEGKMHQDMT